MLPLLILLSGPRSYALIFGLVIVLLGIISLQTSADKNFSPTFIIYALFIGFLYKQTNRIDNLFINEYEFPIDNTILAGIVGCLKATSIEIIVFSLFCFYALINKNH